MIEPLEQAVEHVPVHVPDDDATRLFLDTMTDGTSCKTCLRDVSAGFTALLVDYVRYEAQELRALRAGTQPRPDLLDTCTKYRRALFAIYRKNHGACMNLQ